MKPTNNLHYSEIRTQSVLSKFKGTKVNIIIQCLRMCTQYGDYMKLLMARDYDWECASLWIYGLWWNFVPQCAERKSICREMEIIKDIFCVIIEYLTYKYRSVGILSWPMWALVFKTIDERVAFGIISKHIGTSTKWSTFSRQHHNDRAMFVIWSKFHLRSS